MIPDNFDLVKYGKMVYDLRKKHDLVQDDLADYCGVTRSAFSAIENGRYGPSHRVMLKILKFFRDKGERITMDDCFGVPSIQQEHQQNIEAKQIIELRQEVERLSKQLDYEIQIKEQLKETNTLLKALAKK